MSKSDVLWQAMAFMLMFEGISPLLFPKQWRNAMMEASKFSDKHLRIIGAVLVIAGLSIYWFISN